MMDWSECGMKKELFQLKGSFVPVLLVLLVLMMFASLKNTQMDQMTSLEERIAHTLSFTEGVGEVSVVIRTVKQSRQNTGIGIYADTEEIPCGAVAVAAGAEDPLIKMRLTDALCALLGLQSSQVEVVSMNKGV